MRVVSLIELVIGPCVLPFLYHYYTTIAPEPETLTYFLHFVLVGLQVVKLGVWTYSLDQSGRQGVTTSFKLNKFWSMPHNKFHFMSVVHTQTLYRAGNLMEISIKYLADNEYQMWIELRLTFNTFLSSETLQHRRTVVVIYSEVQVIVCLTSAICFSN